MFVSLADGHTNMCNAFVHVIRICYIYRYFFVVTVLVLELQWVAECMYIYMYVYVGDMCWRLFAWLENAWCLCQDCWRIPWRFRLWRISHIHTHSFSCLSTRPSAPWLLGIPHLPDRKPVRIPNCYCPLQNWSSPSSALVVNDIGAPCSIGDRTEPDRWHQHCWQHEWWMDDWLVRVLRSTRLQSHALSKLCLDKGLSWEGKVGQIGSRCVVLTLMSDARGASLNEITTSVSPAAFPNKKVTKRQCKLLARTAM